jgi:peptidoglycan/LPS O-acetylase OafA/YrhL
VRSGEIKALTGLRLFAAIWVVLFHFRPMLAEAVPDLNTAVAPILNSGARVSTCSSS